MVLQENIQKVLFIMTANIKMVFVSQIKNIYFLFFEQNILLPQTIILQLFFLKLHHDQVYFNCNKQKICSPQQTQQEQMNTRVTWKNRLYENNQVDGQNCCSLALRSLSASSDQTKSAMSREKYRIKSREKGISLTHTTVSLQKLVAPRLNLSVLHIPPKLNPIFSELKQDDSSKNLQYRFSKEKKSKLTQRYVTYKNKRVQERNYHQTQQKSIHHNVPQKNQDEISTCKDTPRIETCMHYAKMEEQYLPKSNYSNSSFNAITAIKNTFDKDQMSCNELKFPSAKTTFEKLYEEHEGRKILTIQSNLSQSEDLLNYSIIESLQLDHNS